jgi:hypothetical protein
VGLHLTASFVAWLMKVTVGIRTSPGRGLGLDVRARHGSCRVLHPGSGGYGWSARRGDGAKETVTAASATSAAPATG